MYQYISKIDTLNMKTLKGHLILLCILLSINALSQNFRGFSGNVDTYLTELSEFLQTTPQKDDQKAAQKYMITFTTFWNSDALTQAQKTSIAQLSVLMHRRKLRPFPHFIDYLNVIQFMAQKNIPESYFMSWQKTIEELLKKSTSRPFEAFIQFSNNFFTDLTLYQSNTVKWQVRRGDYTFEFDTTSRVVFSKPVDLICYANNDTSVIYNTTGVFYPLTNTWQGSGGRVLWTRAGFAPADLYADLNQYTIDVRKREFSATDVLLSYPAFFGGQKLRGTLTEQVLANRQGENAIYPEFVTRDDWFELKNLFDNVDFAGGLTIRGARVYGSGTAERPATVRIYKDGKLFVRLQSLSFIIRRNALVSNNASLSLYLDGDSIYHPGIPVTYDNDKRELRAVQDREGLSLAPYFNSYHRLEMDFKELRWAIDEPKIDFKMIIGPGAEGRATFTSANYYTQFQFEKLLGIDEVHPLIALRNYAERIGSRSFTAQEFARFRRIQVEQIRNQMVMLAIGGYIFYNPESDMIVLKDKVYDFIAASAKRVDYDVIQFQSVITGENNATLSLLNYDLKIRGVSRIFLSDSQMVTIFPANQEIVVKKNRDFLFAGVVRVGLFDYFGHDFSFEYDKFKVNMPLIDSMSFRVKSRTPDEYGFYPYIRVKSVIEDMSGDLLIDHPSNKSGIKPFKEYPIFNSKKYSFVYYDKSSRYKGAYPRTSFFYRIDPFQLDSMNQLTTDGIQFHGYLSSAGIFPDIYEPLRVQDDYSLGIKHKTAPSGLSTYQGKGNFAGLIDLSNQGLRGDGTLNYLTSTSISDKYIFFPDKALSDNVKSFTIRESTTMTEYPSVTGKDVRQEWYPYQDVMIVQTKENPFELYAEKTQLTGQLRLTPTFLHGNGTMEFSNAIITSKKFAYKSRTFDVDTCDFRLKSYDLQELAFVTENYRGHVDFNEKKGTFTANSGRSVVQFPANDYICYMDQFEWYMDKDEIALKSDVKELDYSAFSARELVDIDLTGSEFISIHPAQDSLRFRSSRAKYNLRDKVIRAYDVKVIRVADAAIIPGDGEVTILRKAEMVPLSNAQILANTTTKYHLINNASVQIFGRKSYKASGNYEYVDENNNSQNIFFHTITVDNTLQTVGEANISDSLNFTLSPNFDFYGQVNLYASKEFLTFTGGTRLHHDCDTFPRRWMKFSSEINPQDVIIPVAADLRDTQGNRIFAGLYYNSELPKMYATICGPKYYGGDIEVASASGYMKYDKVTNEYRIGPLEKLSQPSLPGNYLSLAIYPCRTRAEGKLSLGANLGRVELNIYGIASHFSRQDSTIIQAVAELNFYFQNDALALLQQAITSASGLGGINLNSELYSKYLAEKFPPEEAEKIFSEIMLYGQLRKMPDKLKYTITFIDLNLKFDPATKSYISVGPIGIGTIGETQINKYVQGVLQLQLRRGGDRLTFYLEPEPSVWFYFSYSAGLMQAISSEKQFNDFIVNTKPEARQLQSRGDQPAYSYYISTVRRKDAFLKKTASEEDE